MNLIQPLLNSLSPQALGAIAGNINETPERTRQGLADALPVFFASLIAKASTIAGATGLLNMLRSSPVDIDRLTSGRDASAAPTALREGNNIAHSVLGDNFNNAASAISRHSGVGLGSAQSLLGLAAPLALGGIAKAAPAGGFTAEGLMRFLQGQRDDVMAMAPAGLPLNMPSDRTISATHASGASASSRRNSMLPWLIVAGAALLLALALGNWMSQRRPAPAPAPVETSRVAPPPAPAAAGNIIELPGGVRLDLPVGSLGHNLATYLGSAQPAPRTFTFDNLNFDSGNVALTPESTATIDAIAATLRAYPGVMIRLDGHTDTVGERQANVDLSLARANSVARQLTDRGIDAARITAAGFGPDRPVATNDTEEGRAQNRRLELTVTRK